MVWYDPNYAVDINLEAEMAGQHDEDSNEFTCLCPSDKIRLVRRVANLVGDTGVGRWLTSTFGKSKSRNITRWQRVAKHMPSEMLDMIGERVTVLGLRARIKESVLCDKPPHI